MLETIVTVQTDQLDPQEREGRPNPPIQPDDMSKNQFLPSATSTNPESKQGADPQTISFTKVIEESVWISHCHTMPGVGTVQSTFDKKEKRKKKKIKKKKRER